MYETLITAITVTVVSTLTVGVVLDKSKRNEFGTFLTDMGHLISKGLHAIYEFIEKLV